MYRRPSRTSAKPAPNWTDRDLLTFVALCPYRPTWRTGDYAKEQGFDANGFRTALDSYVNTWHRGVRSYAYWDETIDNQFLTFTGFDLAARSLSPDELTPAALALQRVWEYDKSDRINPATQLGVQYCFMRAAVEFAQKKTLPDFSDVAFDDQAWTHWAQNNTDLLELLFPDPGWSRFACALPAPAVMHLYAVARDRLWETGVLECTANLRARIIEVNAARLPASGKSFENFFVFWQDFLKQGDAKSALQTLSADSYEHRIVSAVDSICCGREPQEAADIMTGLLKEGRGAKRLFDHWLLDWIYVVALYRDRERPGSRKKLEQIAGLKKVSENLDYAALWVTACAGALVDIPETRLESIRERFSDRMSFEDSGRSSLANCSKLLFLCAAHHFAQFRFTSYDLTEGDTGLLARNCLLRLEVTRQIGSKEKLAELEQRTGLGPLLPAFVKKQAWERILDRLSAARKEQKGGGTGKNPTENSRLLYRFSPHPFELSVLRQKRTASGWSKGVKVSLSSLKKGGEGMTEQDLRVAAALIRDLGYSSHWRWIPFKAVTALIGSPNVVDAVTDEVLRVERAALQILVKGSESDGWTFESNLDDSYNPKTDPISWYKAGPGRVLVVTPTDEERQLLIETRNVTFPAQAREKLTSFLETLSRTTTVSSPLLKNARSLSRRKGDARVTFRVEPLDKNTYGVSAFVRPLADLDVTCSPGTGLECIAAGSDQIERDLAREAEHFAALNKALGGFAQNREESCSWKLSMLECLNFLETLRACEEHCIVEWPAEEKLKVTGTPLGSDRLALSVMSAGAWLSVQGTVRLNEKSVLTVAELLEKLRQSQGRFIRLSDNEYVALTDSLRRQLELLENASSASKKGAVRVSRFNAAVIETLEEGGVTVEADEVFRGTIERIKAAENSVPAVPSGLRAQLRTYQIEGFEWMSRLADWGAGALLADDMGLGKTLQTIALLLSRAKLGPALVVLPAAVLYNWAAELARFAPSLTVRVLNDADREKTVREASDNEVILTTYGIMTAEIECLALREWATLVYDEAHTLKNSATKMFRAALELKSAARVLLTGTPLQNHLSEIWNLFELADPGLLGPRSDFAERFVLPVEKHGDREVQRRLKRLISPFILRRTKAEVLEELPEKTEITVRVDLSDDERALYESIREQAARDLENGRINAIEALSALTKLRQAACNPALIDPAIRFASSKTAAFIELVDELVDGGHRALVFSQFTSHLALIEKALKKRGIAYLYLDGSTASAQRQKLVDEFQKGDAPLFLISLKAGGTGLNLTAADYVIHLDPWWNPAVEDQASDRSYRIGQDNPVTIYRLIAKDTIEERIVALHASKKSLADALLEGSDVSSRLSKEQILELLAEK